MGNGKKKKREKRRDFRAARGWGEKGGTKGDGEKAAAGSTVFLLIPFFPPFLFRTTLQYRVAMNLATCQSAGLRAFASFRETFLLKKNKNKIKGKKHIEGSGRFLDKGKVEIAVSSTDLLSSCAKLAKGAAFLTVTLSIDLVSKS